MKGVLRDLEFVGKILQEGLFVRISLVSKFSSLFLEDHPHEVEATLWLCQDSYGKSPFK